jgi:uncharacterized protein with FMN-binding domain
MKKLLLGGFVALTFILYAIFQKHDSISAVTPVTTGRETTDTSATATPAAASSSNASSATYKDGQYTGTASDAVYGYIKVKAVVSGGKLTDVQFLQYPDDHHESVEINTQAMPLLKQEAIQAQSADVDIVSGATDTSRAFVESLTAALKGAQTS